MQCVFSPLAELDLEEIGDYIARDNPSRAVSFIREIREQCAKIVPMQHRSHPCARSLVKVSVWRLLGTT